MSVTTNLLTFEDLDRFPEDDGNRYEIIDGELVVSAAPTTAHQRFSLRLTRQLDRHVEAGELGEVLVAPVSVRLAPHQIVAPDIIVVRRERLGIIRAALVDGAPDLVAEILSPSTRRRDLGRKKDLYEQAGVQEYWVADLGARTLTVFVLENARYVPLPPAEGRFRSRLFPDLALDFDALLAGLGGQAATQAAQ